MRIAIRLSFILMALLAGRSGADQTPQEPSVTTCLIAKDSTPVVLENGDSITTSAIFRPPVEITIIAKTDSTNIRMGYAADQIIFNWEVKPEQLRVDGGPANGKHKNGAGLVPTDQYVTIKWLVTDKKQVIRVDDQIRFEHEGDYSKVNKPVRVFSNRSKVSVKHFEVKPLLAGAK